MDPEHEVIDWRRRGLVAGAIAVVLAAILVMAVVALDTGPSAEDALEEFLSAYEEQDYAAAAEMTDGDPAEVAEALEANVDGLDGAALETEVRSVVEMIDEARAEVTYSWAVPEFEERFEYRNRAIRLVEGEEGWRVRWRESVVHPALDSTERLGTTREWPDRAPILDRDGQPIVEPRPVIEIGIVPAEADDVDAAIRAVARVTEAERDELARSVEAAESPENFVPAITLREEEFAEVRETLRGVEGVEFGKRELPLAPTKEFARVLIGSVGPITAEQLSELGEPYATGDNVGQSGLQRTYEEQLAGTPTRSIVVRNVAGTPVETLVEVEGKAGEPLRTTLDREVQNAAEAALSDTDSVVALIALDPTTGDVLASAARPIDDGFNRAFEGQYPPGSTFKVVTTEALLRTGFNPNEVVDCPQTIVAGGREYRNFEGDAAGSVSFGTDFAQSCNTAFVSLADRLGRGDLKEAAELFGLGREIEPGVPAFGGKVPRTRGGADHASSVIGQGRILVSPLAMAGVAATVADGRWRSPRVLADAPTETGPPLPSDELNTLRSLMGAVITQGTGTALAGVPSPVIGKSGTAEYGSGDPPPTHAWFIAARPDIAVAVLVEDAPSGGEFAAPIAAEFLTAVVSQDALETDDEEDDGPSASTGGVGPPDG